ncbi:MAG: hypothetical protein GXP33_10260 [Spirochaetes bacterium]|nr:hypothetical protein [Spirochaetota bacterium]
MKSIRRAATIILLFAVILLLGSCNILQMFFGPDKNDISAWWPKDFKVGTRLSYRYYETYTDSGYNYEENIIVEITDIDERETRTIIKTSEDGAIVYYIIDKENGKLIKSTDSSVDDNDEVVLKTPVEEGTTWYNWTNTRYEIDNVKENKTVEAGTFDDVVVLKVSDPDWTTITSVNLYISTTGGNLGWVQKYDSSVSYYGIMENGIELQDIDKP